MPFFTVSKTPNDVVALAIGSGEDDRGNVVEASNVIEDERKERVRVAVVERHVGRRTKKMSL